ncbi:tetratricopeptide repeat protein [Horticoccus sp. 23ND18S-11]|uniref:hypothetical protein n=1 Tax=Horticoccus sp. 23ND18S-11 TaxID=3391832 RepID=UPI0039C9700C
MITARHLQFILAGAVAAVGCCAAPDVTLSLRGVVDGQLEQGEPLAATVLLAAPVAQPGVIELAPARGTWADALIVELSPAGGGAPVARAQPLRAPENPVAVLDADRVAGGLWSFSAETMRSLAPGDYLVKARLELPAGRGWSGVALAEAWPLRIVTVSADPLRRAARAHARAQLSAAAGRLEEAARACDAALEKTPDDLELLSLRADVALRGGNPIAARFCVNRAVRQLKGPLAGPLPLVLHEVSARVYAAIVPVGATATKPPDWTWPPASVMTLSAEVKPVTPVSPPAPTAPRPTTTAPVPVAAAVASPPPVVTQPVQPSPGVIVPAAELDDAKVRADSAGQWAAAARAGSFQRSTYNYYTPARATGEPKVAYAGYNTEAWCPAQQNSGEDWIELTFARPTPARGVRVRQTFNPGAIVKVEAVATDGTVHLWWAGSDPYPRPATRAIAWFAVNVPATRYAVAKIRLTLNLAAVPGWKQIDAVQLVAAPR